MSLAFCILGSGSAGNCTAVLPDESHRACILIDAGLSPRRTHRLLQTLGRSIDDVCAIVLTHLDSDHFHSGWLRVIARRARGDCPLMLHVHRRHRGHAWRSGLTARHVALFEECIHLPGGVRAEPVLLAHDDLGSVGFVIERHGHRLGYATDLGRVSRDMLDRFVSLHALALESNYDPPMQRDSMRPAFLKRRIMDGRGHLSNEQALDAVRQIERRSRWLSQIALLHLSRECNCPHRVRALWRREMPHALHRLTISHQRRPTALLPVAGPAAHVMPHVQLTQPLLFEMAG
jgi:phosphoribosyl 1,2-cyclic phosphodiesterase